MPHAVSRRVWIQGAGSYRLAGVLHLPQGQPSAAALLAHCFTCSKDYKLIVWLARALASFGLAALRMDMAGLGDSEGDFAGTTLSSEVADLQQAARWLQEEVRRPVRLMLGHSMGGAAAIQAAASIPSVPTVAVCGTSADPSRLARLLNRAERNRLQHEGVVEVAVMGRPFPISRARLEDLEQHDLLQTVSRWDKALAVFHGSRDELVPLVEAERLFRAASEPKLFASMAGADHLMADRQVAERIGALLKAWAGF